MSFKCAICAIEKPDEELHDKYINICKKCISDNKNRKAMIKRRNDGWMQIAEDNNIELYDRQPTETDTEWKVWQAYSGMYPDAKPTYTGVAAALGMSLSHVKNCALRWDYNVRIQSYKQFVDSLTKQHRAEAIKEMNEQHLSMASKLRAKLDNAIDALQPEYMKPAEIASMVKVMAELERKAHIDAETREQHSVVALDSNSGENKVTKKEDMSEILAILGAAGVLQGKNIGIEKTERIVIKED